MVEEHLRRKPPLIENVCTDCLKKCIKKRELTKHVPANYLRTIEIKLIKLQSVEYMLINVSESYKVDYINVPKYFHVGKVKAI